MTALRAGAVRAREASAGLREARVIFFNQGGGPLFRALVGEAAQALGPVVYCSADLRARELPGVRLHAMPPNRNDSAAKRILAWLAYLARSALVVARSRPDALLFFVTNPPLTPVLGLLAKRVLGRRVVLLFYDLFPEALEEAGYLPHGSLVSRLWRWLNRRAVRGADRVVTISAGMARTLAQYGGPAQGVKLEIVPTWVDTDWIRPLPKPDNAFATAHGQTDRFTVMYAGNLGEVHDLRILPEVADRLRDVPGLHFMIIGEGSGRAALQEEIARRTLDNVTLLPLQDEALLPQVLATADLAVVALRHGAEGISMPSKTYFAMAAGSALLGLCSARSDLAEVIRRCDCGDSVEPHDVGGAVRAILRYREEPGLRARHGERARLAAEREFSRARCVPRLLDVIRTASADPGYTSRDQRLDGALDETRMVENVR